MNLCNYLCVSAQNNKRGKTKDEHTRLPSLLLFESWGHVYADPEPHEVRHAPDLNKPISKDVGRPRNLVNKANYKWTIRTTLIEKEMSEEQISNNEIRPAPVVRCERLLYLVHISTLRIINERESKNNIQHYLP